MNNLLNRLLLGGSAIAFVATTSATAYAQPAIETVTVTGTSIRGAAPVGTNLITVDEKTIETTAPVSMQELLNSVPGLSTVGGPPQGTSINSFFTPQIHQLAGSVSNSTLTTVDGLRLVGVGGDTLPDPNIIPTSAIQRVEVIAGGVSSVYGSDGVSGVVNFITRKSYDGVELTYQHGQASDYGNDTGTLLWGTSWNTGSALVAGSYAFQSRLRAATRPFLTKGDYTAMGGNNAGEVFGCPVASMIVPGNTGVFYNTTSTTAVANTQTSANCNFSALYDTLPESVRRNGLIKVTNDFGSRLSVTAMMDYNALNNDAYIAPGQITSVVVFGPNSGKGTTATATTGGQINPFYQRPAGAPTASQETVSWVDLMGNGANGNDFGHRQLREQVFYGTLVANYKITNEWTASFSDAVGQGEFDSSTINGFCAPCATLALNGTNVKTGSTTTSDVAGKNIIALNLPLTVSNALDIWDSAGSGNQTSAILRQSLYNGTTNGRSNNTLNQSRIQVDGPLFALPAGDVKAAAGAEYQLFHLITESTGSAGTGDLSNGTQDKIFRSARNVMSGFAELNVPVISPEMNYPFMQKVEVDISGRYDQYNDVGHTFNPKYALDWTVLNGLKLRANYSTSFVAPIVGVIGDPAQGGMYSGGTSAPAAFNVPVAAFPGVKALPGCATATVSCSIGGSNLAQGLDRQYGGGLANVKPQTGNGWALGADVAPSFLPGFLTSISVFNQNYKGGVTAPNANQVTTYSALFQNLQFFPNGATQAQIDAFTRVPQGGQVQGQIPATVYFTLNRDENNVLYLDIQGIDLQANYDFDTDIGHFHASENLTEVWKFTQNFFNSASFSILNTSGLNSTFASIARQSRSSLGWSEENFEVDAFVNYTGAYRNAGNSTVNPILLDANSNFAGGGDHVHANVTVDAHAAYNFSDGMFLGDQIYIDVKNLFDKTPPFYNYVNHGDALSNFGYNPFVSNPIGRIVSIGVRAKF